MGAGVEVGFAEEAIERDGPGGGGVPDEVCGVGEGDSEGGD